MTIAEKRRTGILTLPTNDKKSAFQKVLIEFGGQFKQMPSCQRELICFLNALKRTSPVTSLHLHLAPIVISEKRIDSSLEEVIKEEVEEQQ